MNTAYIAIGSNLDNPTHQVTLAIDTLRQSKPFYSVTASSLYANKAIGPGTQPDYVNAVIRVNTQMKPNALLTRLQAIEHHHGRHRSGHQWSPRTLDLDIILYNDLCLTTADLVIPHPRMHERSFVILPLLEIEPSLCMPDGTPLHQLVASIKDHTLTKLEASSVSNESHIPPL